MYELVIDNFAGGGGASTGIEMAIGRSVDIAINHDPDAIAMHKANHPDTKHYCESVWDVDPIDACAGRPVGLAWFSPDCKHFSKAKGGKPKDKNIRGLAWVAVKWAKAVKPRVIMLENVEEFKTWGPLDDDGYPIKERKGETFRAFIKQLNRLGYEVDWRELRACDYGAPTIRKRFFLVARCDGKPIVWPEPTHGKPDTPEVRMGLLKEWRPVAECIDWSKPMKSIFDRSKPLAENTMRRIARGFEKFVMNNPKPYIVRIGQTGFGGDNMSYSIDQPLTTIVSKAEHLLVTPYLVQYHSEQAKESVRGQELRDPIMTVDSSNRYGLVAAFIAKHFGGNYTGSGASIDDPLPTVTSKDHNAIVTAYMARQFGTSTGHKVDEPLGTVTSVNKSQLVTAFLTKYYGAAENGQSIADPLHTITSKDRFGLVTIHGIEYQIVDIKMRMLEPRELFNASGFPEGYIIDQDFLGNTYSRAKQVARVGNAVTPPIPAALVRANLPELSPSVLIEKSVSA